MKAVHSFTPRIVPGRIGRVLEIGGATGCPWHSRARPASAPTPTEAETLLRMCTGFQPSSAAFLIACAANFGVVTLTKMSAPEALRPHDLRVDRRIGRSRRASRRRSSRPCRRARPSGPSVVLAVVVVLEQHARSCRPDGSPGCTWRRCGLRSGSWAASPSSRGSSSGRPIWSRRSRRRAAAPSWRSCISGSPNWAPCRAAGRSAAPRRSRPACAPARPSSAAQ